MNRLFAWRNLTASRVLQHIDGKDADPRFFAEMLSYIHDKITSRPEWCPVEDILQKTNYYDLYMDMITDHLKQLVREEAMTLTDIVNKTVAEDMNCAKMTEPFYEFQRENPEDRLNCNLVLGPIDNTLGKNVLYRRILQWFSGLQQNGSIDYYLGL